ncbi:MAG: biotin carboxylase N-terminal domain-containing protein [Parasphingopyxis sp.]|uniref:acetyl/propionyl/methylcrotonyl-CoA carboxylase subunit alpha n=1 Tax=Parasphingopyxis sp. TaxID=1920299 RepID=UPI0032ED7720
MACLIIRTARRLGIRAVAVYSDADAKALHVREADEAVHIGPSPAAESYLVGDKIIAAAKETGAEAIHPGYGFLSENADFAQAVLDAGLIWVGPKPESIRAMGLKDAAKTLMDEAGVPTTPGYLGDNQDADFLAEQAEKIGYPVLIKAVAGGGGKGMRKVDEAANFADALQSCRREAQASFGNDIVLLEKWIESPRHIEVQVFGDSHGNVVHLFERDCSLQRRHQKVIEEAPAPGMDSETREAVCAAAVRAAKAVDYEGAGTIEFIADASEGLRADRIWFMEMNTRLQVEHPVTEMITGVDLVEWQLKVASGKGLPLRQKDLAINGHAIEARLYAENPANGFLPSTGRLEVFRIDAGYAGRRFDSGFEEGATVTPHYDPMLAKLIVHDDSRDHAIESMLRMLEESFVWPLKNNMGFAYECLDCAPFRAADLDTGLIERLGDKLTDGEVSDERISVAASGLWSFGLGGQTFEQAQLLTGLKGFRLNAPVQEIVRVFANAEPRIVGAPDGETRRAGSFSISDHGTDGCVVNDRGNVVLVSMAPHGGFAGAGAAGDGAILAPMPGKVIAVNVAAGDTVSAGDKLLTLEAMKMEHTLTAPFDGVVAELDAEEGGQVTDGAVLAKIEAAGE